MKTLPRLRLLVLLGFSLLATLATAGVLTIKSPTDGAFLGRTNQLRFLLTGSRVEATVNVRITSPGGGITTLQQKFTPNSSGEIDNSIALNFGESSPLGDYTAVVTVTEPANTYNTGTVGFKVDVKAPTFQGVTPIEGAFVKGLVRIRARISETNLERWEVKVNNEVIPDNSGTTNDLAVNYDASNVTRDGPQQITIIARDLAGNVTTRNLTVTLDRIRPSLVIVYPLADTRILRGSSVTVLVDVSDAASTSVNPAGIDILFRGMDGTLLGRVARVSVRASGGTTLRWTGRISGNSRLPASFKIVATATDRAGNVGTPQEVVVTLR